MLSKVIGTVILPAALAALMLIVIVPLATDPVAVIPDVLVTVPIVTPDV